MSEEVSVKRAVAGMTLRYTEIASVILCRQVLEKLISQTEMFNTSKLDVYSAPLCEKLASETLRFGSRSCYTANSPHLPLHRSIHQMAPPL